MRESPYGINDIWQLDEVLTIVSYEPALRNQAIITLLWDLDARPHEISGLGNGMMFVEDGEIVFWKTSFTGRRTTSGGRRVRGLVNF